MTTLDDAQLEAVRTRRAGRRSSARRHRPAPTSPPALARLRGEPRAARAGDAREEDTPSGRVEGRARAARCRCAMPRSARARPASSTTRSRRSRPRTTCRPATPTCCASSSSSRPRSATRRPPRATSRRSRSCRPARARATRCSSSPTSTTTSSTTRVRARAAMRAAADAFGSGTRRDATLRMLAIEAASHLAWDVAVDALNAIEPARRTGVRSRRCSRPRSCARASVAEAVALVEDATAAGKFDDGGQLSLAARRAVAQGRARERARRARGWRPVDDADELRAEATSCGTRSAASPACRRSPRSAWAPRRSPRRCSRCRRAARAADRRAPREPRRSGAAARAARAPRRSRARRCAARCSSDVADRRHGPRAGDRAARARADRARARAAIRSAPPRCGRRRTASIRATRRCGCRSPTRSPAPTSSTLARELYEQIARFERVRRRTPRAGRAERAEALGRDDSIVSGRDRRARAAPPPAPHPRRSHDARARARRARATGRPRSTIAERAAAARPGRHRRARAARAALLRGRRRHRGVRGDRPPARCSPTIPSDARDAVAPPREAVSRRARPRRRGVSLPQGGARVLARRSGDRVPAAHRRDGARRVGARRVAALSRDRGGAPTRAIAARSTSSSR